MANEITTVKAAILKSLDEINRLTTYMQIYEHIVAHKYYLFEQAKTPWATISAQLGEFIRRGDSRVKRIKQNGGYYYYLTKNESRIDFGGEFGAIESPNRTTETKKTKTFHERDLHKLLSTFLITSNTFSKTIFHEESNRKDNNQKWIHPDMVGVNFLSLKTIESQNFQKSINRADTLKLTSYELKREINSDVELKNAFFQAVSNSSWANYGYLVAFDFGDNLLDEMARLNQSFGIGIIELSANPFQSKILFPAAFKSLDFQTIDKLCNINNDFKRFIAQIEKCVTASEKYISSAEFELKQFCDEFLNQDSEIEAYCRDKNIPIEAEDVS